MYRALNIEGSDLVDAYVGGLHREQNCREQLSRARILQLGKSYVPLREQLAVFMGTTLRCLNPPLSVTTTVLAPLSAATRRSILLLSFATFASMAAQRICDAMLANVAK